MLNVLRHFIAFQKLFLGYTGWRLPILYLVIATGGLVEAVGIVSILPLLNVATGGEHTSALSRTIVDVLGKVGITPTLTNMLVLIIAIFTLRGAIVYAQTYFTAYILLGVRKDVQIRLTRRFSGMSFPYFTRRPAGWFNNIITVEIGRFVSSMRSFSRLSVNLINALIFLPIVLALRFELTVAVFALGGAVLWSLKGFIRRTAARSRSQTQNAGRLNSEFIQLIQAFVYLKATNSTAAANQHVIGSIGRLTDDELAIRRTGAMFEAIQEPIAVAALAAFIYIEVAVLGGSLTEILVVALLIYRVLRQLVSLAPQLQNFNQTIGGMFVVQDVSRDLDRHTEPNGPHRIEKLDSEIVFHKVGFDYAKTPVLRNVNIVLRPNETIGIVGGSGAGKTTFFHLLTGLLEPTRGDITIGGMSYGTIDKNSLRARIGYVTQDPIIFNDTVAANISMWAYTEGDKKCMARIRAAARAARCDDFVRAMGDGYHSVLGERGVNLSGGERQRIAIAREIFKNPQLLIFDEAASALDAESERYVQESIDRMHGERTVVVITHRLASVRNCDRIYVFQSGRVVEEGSFDKLYARKGSYFRHLCDQQELSR